MYYFQSNEAFPNYLVPRLIILSSDFHATVIFVVFVQPLLYLEQRQAIGPCLCVYCTVMPSTTNHNGFKTAAMLVKGMPSLTWKSTMYHHHSRPLIVVMMAVVDG